MKKHLYTIFLVLLTVSVGYSNVFSQSGDRSSTSINTDEFLIDHSLYNPMGNMADTFDIIHPNLYMLRAYSNETDIVNKLINGNTKMVILARDFSVNEKQVISERNGGELPHSRKIAVDAVAVIVNNENIDSQISTQTLQKVLTGEITQWKDINPKSELDDIILALDDSETGIWRYLTDSVSKGNINSRNLRLQSDNQRVLEYVIETPGALGLVSVSWVINTADPQRISFTDRCKVMSISASHPATSDNSFLPYAAYLALEQYPLSRDIYMVLTDKEHVILSKYAEFIASDKGQRIIADFGLLPAAAPIRIVRTDNKLEQ